MFLTKQTLWTLFGTKFYYMYYMYVSLPTFLVASNLVFLGLLLAFSVVAAVGQAFFQIALATDYSQQLHPCEL